MSERGVAVDHTTLFRWVQHYAPLMENRVRMIRKRQCLMLESGTTGEVRFVNRLFRLAALIRREERGRFRLTNATEPFIFDVWRDVWRRAARALTPPHAPAADSTGGRGFDPRRRLPPPTLWLFGSVNYESNCP